MTNNQPDDRHSYRQRIYRLIAGTYLTPMILYSGYALTVLPFGASWGLIILGCLTTTFGATAILLLLRHWEFVQRKSIDSLVEEKSLSLTDKPAPSQVVEINQPPPSDELSKELEGSHQQITSLLEQLEARDRIIERLQADISRLTQDSHALDQKVKSTNEDSHNKVTQLKDYQQTIREQRSIIDQKQQYISKLEIKIQDLTYEVKTLLQLGDLNPHHTADRTEPLSGKHPVLDVFQQPQHETQIEEMVSTLPVSSDKTISTHYDAAVQLQKCVDIAKKLTGASHLATESSRFLDLSLDSHAIDLRRLFDNFRNEHTCTIMLYTQKDERMLFVNNQVKGLLGWSTDKFMKDFSQLIEPTLAEWKHALKQIQDKNEIQVQLLAKNKNGEEIPLHCYLGKIPSGAFENHIIGVLYPA